MPQLELKSPHDGSILIFDVTSRNEEEVLFSVHVKTPWFSGVAPSSTFMVLPPSDLFRAMAAEWKGWKTEKTWSDLEDRVSIAATSDSTGHIRLAITLRGQDGGSRLHVDLMYEAGQLQQMADELALLFR
jgi:hypothetical protein